VRELAGLPWISAKSDYRSVKRKITVCACVFTEQPAEELDQLELASLCDGLHRYLHDLPQAMIPPVLYAQMVQTAQGERRRLRNST